jgi:hypothetical protein
VVDHQRRRGDAQPRPLSAIVRAIGGAPVKVRTKLLVAFAAIAALLIVVAVLGLRVLGQSNSRVESLGTLQLRAATYQSLQTQAQELRQLLAIRVAEDPGLNGYLSRSSSDVIRGRTWVLADKTIAAAVSQLGPATSATGLGFSPPVEDRALIDRIRSDYRRFKVALAKISAADRSGGQRSQNQRLLTDSSSSYSRRSSSFIRLTFPASAPSSSRLSTSSRREKSPAAISARRTSVRWIGRTSDADRAKPSSAASTMLAAPTPMNRSREEA